MLTNMAITPHLQAIINNDGFDDILIGSDGGSKRIYLYYGGTNMDTEPDHIFPGNSDISYAGDVNGDQIDDIIAGGSIYYGDTTPDFIADITFDVTHLTPVGDINNDGYTDFAGLLNDTAYVFIGASVLDSIPDITLGAGSTISKAGDINNDGFDDIVVGLSTDNSSRGRMQIYYGSINFDSIPDITYTGEEFSDKFGYSLSSGFDINADGYADIVCGAPNNEFNGAVYLYFGGQIVFFSKHPKNSVICEEDTTLFTTESLIAINYQWQVSPDSGITYTNIEDNNFYNGAGTNQLEVIANYALSDNLYRCKAIKDDFVGYSEPASLSIHKKPSVTLIGGDSICEGDSTQLDIHLQGSGPWIFHFSDGVYTREIECFDSVYSTFIDSSGLYKIVSLQDKNCTSTNIVGESTVFVNPLPKSTLSGGDTICEGDTTYLEIGLTGKAPWNYSLSSDSNSINFTTNESYNLIPITGKGTYKITALHDVHCEGKELSGTASVVLNDLPAGILCSSTDFCAGDSNIACMHFTGEAPWKFTLSDSFDQIDLVTHENPFYFSIDSVGIYEIKSLTDANCTSTNACGKIIVSLCSSLTRNEINKLCVYPNPTKGKIQISNSKPGDQIKIVSIEGFTIYSTESYSDMIEIDISGYHSGIYLIQVISPDGIISSKTHLVK